MSTGPVVVFGILGQVGSALMKRLGSRDDVRAIGFRPEDADFSAPDELAARLPGLLGGVRPSAVINAAAYTAVDKAEKERELAFALNAEAPAVLARWCAEHGVPFVHYSTDYVYPGDGSDFRDETAATGPLGVYGESKLEGDRQVAAAGGDHLIFRTSWVYDATGANFLRTMLRLGAEREELRVVSDQVGAPTFAGHLADATLVALERGLVGPGAGRAAAGRPAVFPSGVYHLCNSGVTSWHGFASAIFEQARKRGLLMKVREVVPIPASDYPTPARRPLNSRLSLRKIETVFGIRPPSWQAGLEECMNEYAAVLRGGAELRGRASGG